MRKPEKVGFNYSGEGTCYAVCVVQAHDMFSTFKLPRMKLIVCSQVVLLPAHCAVQAA